MAQDNENADIQVSPELLEVIARVLPWGTLPALPHPGRSEGGRVKCNAPYDVAGLTVAHCGRWVRKDKPHRGQHRLEWNPAAATVDTAPQG